MKPIDSTSHPRVSYVMASYNHEDYVAEAVRSILNQTYTDLELVVVDDGSTDRTPQIVRELATSDRRVRVYEQENRGVVSARNRGMRSSKGEYVSVVDSDDLLPPERTELQVCALNADPRASLVYGDAWIVDRVGQRLKRRFEVYPPIPGDFSSELFANYCFVPAITVMFRRSMFDETGPFWGPGPNTDYLKWIELGLRGRAICLSDKQLGCWRSHGGNTSTAPAAQRVRQYERLREGLEALASRHPELTQRLGARRLGWRYGRCHFMGAFYAGLEGEWGRARSQFAQAFRLHPSLTNGAAFASTLPVVRQISAPLYAAAARRLL